MKPLQRSDRSDISVLLRSFRVKSGKAAPRKSSYHHHIRSWRLYIHHCMMQMLKLYKEPEPVAELNLNVNINDDLVSNIKGIFHLHLLNCAH